MSNEPTTSATHPFVFDLLGGWHSFLSDDDRYSEAYRQVAYEFYQRAGAETVGWDDGEGRDLTLAEQFEWLRTQLDRIEAELGALEGTVHNPAGIQEDV